MTNKLIQLGNDVKNAADIINITYEDDPQILAQDKHIVTFGFRGSFDEENKYFRSFCKRFYFHSFEGYTEFLKSFREFMNNENQYWDASQYIKDKYKPAYR
jgi:hypothetical protein